MENGTERGRVIPTKIDTEIGIELFIMGGRGPS
jgi:hypothetical protein